MLSRCASAGSLSQLCEEPASLPKCSPRCTQQLPSPCLPHTCLPLSGTSSSRKICIVWILERETLPGVPSAMHQRQMGQRPVAQGTPVDPPWERGLPQQAGREQLCKARVTGPVFSVTTLPNLNVLGPATLEASDSGISTHFHRRLIPCRKAGPSGLSRRPWCSPQVSPPVLSAPPSLPHLPPSGLLPSSPEFLPHSIPCLVPQKFFLKMGT